LLFHEQYHYSSGVTGIINAFHSWMSGNLLAREFDAHYAAAEFLNQALKSENLNEQDRLLVQNEINAVNQTIQNLLTKGTY
jgi:hypothetical protein